MDQALKLLAALTASQTQPESKPDSTCSQRTEQNQWTGLVNTEHTMVYECIHNTESTTCTASPSRGQMTSYSRVFHYYIHDH